MLHARRQKISYCDPGISLSIDPFWQKQRFTLSDKRHLFVTLTPVPPHVLHTLPMRLIHVAHASHSRRPCVTLTLPMRHTRRRYLPSFLIAALITSVPSVKYVPRSQTEGISFFLCYSPCTNIPAVTHAPCLQTGGMTPFSSVISLHLCSNFVAPLLR